ncbi:Peptidoglycan binding-like [Rhabdaerophilaceae bacterium]
MSSLIHDERSVTGEIRADRASRSSGVSPKPSSKTPRQLRRRFFTRQTIMIGGSILAAIAIILNAVFLQSERHPEPLFQPVAKAPMGLPVPPQRVEITQAKAPETRPQAVRAPATAPSVPVERLRPSPPSPTEPTEALLSEIQRELAKRGHFKGEADGKVGPRTTQAIRDFQFAQRVAVDGRPTEALLTEIMATKTTMKDELMDLVRRASTEDAPPRTVRDIQRALNKGGYGPLKEDGQWGAATRTALTRFEQDNRLPMKGEPKGQNIRTLASVTGIQIAQ